MIRVRACTMRRRCHNSCRRSRFSELGTQICGKRFFVPNVGSVAHPGDPSSASALALSSRLHLRSATQTATRPRVARTSARGRWLPSHPPFSPASAGRTLPPPPDALAASPGTLRCRYPPKLFAETPVEIYPIMIIVRLLSPEPVWLALAPPTFLGRREPTLSWNQLHSLTGVDEC